MENLDRNRNWLALYREAVLEPDRKKVKTRIAQAQDGHPRPSTGIVVRRNVRNDRAPPDWTQLRIS